MYRSRCLPSEEDVNACWQKGQLRSFASFAAFSAPDGGLAITSSRVEIRWKDDDRQSASYPPSFPSALHRPEDLQEDACPAPTSVFSASRYVPYDASIRPCRIWFCSSSATPIGRVLKIQIAGLMTTWLSKQVLARNKP